MSHTAPAETESSCEHEDLHHWGDPTMPRKRRQAEVRQGRSFIYGPDAFSALLVLLFHCINAGGFKLVLSRPCALPTGSMLRPPRP